MLKAQENNFACPPRQPRGAHHEPSVQTLIQTVSETSPSSSTPRISVCFWGDFGMAVSFPEQVVKLNLLGVLDILGA